METKGDISLEIESKKDVRSAGVLQLQKGIRLVFVNEDQREEFIEFIARIIN